MNIKIKKLRNEIKIIQQAQDNLNLQGTKENSLSYQMFEQTMHQITNCEKVVICLSYREFLYNPQQQQ